MVASRVGGSDLMLPNRRSPPSPHGISKRTMCRLTRQRYRGRLLRLGEMSEDDAQPLHRGSGGSTYTAQHGKPQSVVRDDQPDAHEGQAGRCGVAERPVVPLKPGNAGGGKGPQFKTDARRSEGPGDWATYQRQTAFRNCRRRCTRKRRQNPTFASTPSTTRSAARTFWRTPILSAAPTRARRAWTVRTSRLSRRTGLSDGRANWRLRSGRRLTDRTLSDAFSYRRPTANSGRWASQPCGIGSA